MPTPEFEERILAIRVRFASRLVAEIDDTNAALPILEGGEMTSSDAVAVVYRRFHSMCGIAPTIGFESVGKSAQVLDKILIEPFRAKRGLTPDEMEKVKAELVAFRAAAHVEMQLGSF